jgi:hypothetical protein
MSQFQYSLRLPEECNSEIWMDNLFVNVDDDYVSSDEESEKFSDLYYTKKLSSTRLDSNDEIKISSPTPLFRMNALNEYSPPFEVQMENKYLLKKGNIYSFVEFYPLSQLNKNTEIYNEIEIKRIVGKFDKYVDIDTFRFIVDGVLYLTNRRNFEKNIRGYSSDFEEVDNNV